MYTRPSRQIPANHNDTGEDDDLATQQAAVKLLSLASFYYQHGKLDEAVVPLEKALAIRQKLAICSDASMNCLRILARVYSRLGDYEKLANSVGTQLTLMKKSPFVSTSTVQNVADYYAEYLQSQTELAQDAEEKSHINTLINKLLETSKS